MIKKHALMFFLLISLIIQTATIYYTGIVEAQDQLTLNSYNGFLTTSGYYVVGEVQNIWNTPVKNIVLEITFFLSNGQNFSRTTGLSLPVLLEGRRSPFVYWITNATLAAQINSINVKIQAYEQAEMIPTNLAILSHTSVRNSVLGYLRNDGDATLFAAEVLATFYDENYTVLGVESARFMNVEIGTIGEYFNITFPFVENAQTVKFYSLAANSVNPEYQNNEDIALIPMDSGVNGGLTSMFLIFALVIVFSAIILIGAYIISRMRERRKRQRRESRRRKLAH